MKTKTTGAVKGFTLVELVVVMAIFSFILFGALQFVDPVTKIYTRTANYESAVGSIDSMQTFLTGNLQTVQFLHVYDGTIGADDIDEEYAKVAQFMEDYHKNRVEGTVQPSDTPIIKELDGKKYILGYSETLCDYIDVVVNVIKIDNRIKPDNTPVRADGNIGVITKHVYSVNTKADATGSINVGAVNQTDSTEYAVNQTYYDRFAYQLNLTSTEYNKFQFNIRSAVKSGQETMFADALTSLDTNVSIGLTNIVANHMHDTEKIEIGGGLGERPNVKLIGWYTAKDPITNTVSKMEINGENYKYFNSVPATDCIYLVYSYSL